MSDIPESRKAVDFRGLIQVACFFAILLTLFWAIQKGPPGPLNDALFLVGLWSLPSTGAARLTRKIRESARGGVYTEISQAVRSIVTLVSPVVRDLSAGSNVQPEREESRLSSKIDDESPLKRSNSI
jgi:hypothetical protein